jgi:type I restriction enzyme S subunit
MADINKLITDNIDVWTSAIKKRNSQGRGTSKKIELTGIKKLRELILELAVRGKLVPQDLSDEPASVLLKQIAEEKAQLIADKKIKKQKPLPSISDEEKPFELPKGWEWTRFDLLPLGYSVGLDRGKSQQSSDKEYLYFKMNNISNEGGSDLSSVVYVDATETEVEQYSLRNNDLLFNTRNSRELVGKTCVFLQESKSPTLYNNNILRAYFSESIISSMIDIWMRSPSGKAELEQYKSGTTNVWAIYQGKLLQLHCLIPPLAEQHRIVAKVDELMALCDQLEQQTEQSLSAHQTLVEVLLAALTKSDSAEDFQTSWQRIAEHFDVLFTTELSIDKLKQTILQLAVMGKLVPQNPSDEPVDKLLARIASHRDERVKNKEMQKFKLVKPIDDPNSEVPLSWKSILLNDLVFVTKLAGFEYTKHIDLKDSGEVPVIRAQNVRPFRPDLRNLKYIDEETSMALPRSALDRAALLITFIGAGIGDVCLLNENKRFHLAPNVAKVEAFSDLSLQYLSVYLNSPLGKVELFKSMKSTAQPSISMTTLREMWVSLPPLAEQHRIVAKVDELMALCDQLKARLSDAQTTQLHLADAVVENALA